MNGSRRGGAVVACGEVGIFKWTHLPKQITFHSEAGRPGVEC